jgi:hypothetical protein
MDFSHSPKIKILKILKIKITTFWKLALLLSTGEWTRRRGEYLFCCAPFTCGWKQSQLPKRCDFNTFNILLFGRRIKSTNPSPQNIIRHRQNLLEWIRNTRKVLKCGAGEGWRISVRPIV